MDRPFLYLICIYLFFSAFPSKGFVKTEDVTDGSQTTAQGTTDSPYLNGGCPPDFFGLPGTSWCYHVGGINSSEWKTFNNADEACDDLMPTSRLASIHSNTDQKFIMTLVATLKKPVWIGLKRSESGLTWVDNTTTRFSNWGRKQNSIDKDCVAMQTKNKVAGDWQYDNCRNKLPFVCEYEKDPTVDPKIPHAKCGKHYLEFRGSCYRLVSRPKNWFESEKMCSDHGGHLLSIEDRYEEAFMEILFDLENQTETWIGLSDISDEYTFAWSDGWPVMYTNWGSNQPDLSSDCVAHERSSDWITKKCRVDLPYVCEFNKDAARHPVKKPIVPGKCPHKGWLHIEEYCYFVETQEKKSWPEAKSACEKSNNSHLASIHNEKENFFISKFIHHDEVNVWIGLKRNGSEAFKWSDQSEFEYSAWAPQFPTASDGTNQETCTLAQSSDGKWKTTSYCSTQHGFVCKMKQVPIITTAVTSTFTTAPTTTNTTDVITNSTTAPTTTNTTDDITNSTTAPTTTTITDVITNSTTQDSHTLEGGIIAGIVMSTLVFIAFVIAAIFLCRRRSDRPIAPGKETTQRFESVSYRSRSNSSSSKVADQNDIL